MPQKQYSSEDEQIILDNYYARSDGRLYCAEKLGVPPNAIEKKAKRLRESGAVFSKNTPTGDYSAILEKECREAGISPDDVAYWWYKTQNASIFVRKPGHPTYEDIREELVKEVKKYAPKYKKRKGNIKGENLLVMPHADIHVGKWADIGETGNSYSIPKAVKRAREGTDSLMDKAEPFGVKKIILCIGNDILHVDNSRGTTTSGTGQDTHQTIFRMFDEAKALYVGLIEQLALHVDVHLVFVPSNHDWVSGYMLCDAVTSWFHNHPHVSWDGKALHRKFVVFGRNLLMFTHGDGAKDGDLHYLMANEAKEAWGNTDFRYIFCGHIHHKDRKARGRSDIRLEKDKIGHTFIDCGRLPEPTNHVHIEYLRSPSPADGWHHKNGFVSTPAMEAFVHHPSQGQMARFTHYF